jgi:hypothetical protein
VHAARPLGRTASARRQRRATTGGSPVALGAAGSVGPSRQTQDPGSPGTRLTHRHGVRADRSIDVHNRTNHRRTGSGGSTPLGVDFEASHSDDRIRW